jgi:hypothetical protein
VRFDAWPVRICPLKALKSFSSAFPVVRSHLAPVCSLQAYTSSIQYSIFTRLRHDYHEKVALFNSLRHLTYLTSTSPRIREIMTMDGGLERLVRILHEFCVCPPPPENPAIFYGLMPPSARPPKLSPALNPPHIRQTSCVPLFFGISMHCQYRG